VFREYLEAEVKAALLDAFLEEDRRMNDEEINGTGGEEYVGIIERGDEGD
jgi:hypothetical protein